MRRAIYQLTALFLGFGLLTLANGLLSSVLVLRMEAEGISIQTSGLVMSAHSIGMLAGPFLVPRLIHRVGHIRLFTIMAALIAVVTITYPLVIHPVTWFGFRVIGGFALAGSWMILESWLNQRAESDMRGQVMAVYMGVNYMCFGLGQLLLLIGNPASFELFSIAAALFAASLLPIAATRISEPERPAPHVPSFRRLWGLSPLGTVGCFAAGFLGMAFVAAGPLFARGIGFDTNEIAVFMGVAIFAGLAFQLPAGKLSDVMDRRKLIAGIAFAVVVAAVLTTLAARFGVVWAIIAVAVYGGIVYTLYPVAVAHANDMVDREDTVALAAGLIFASGLGATVGPIAATSAMALIGPDGMFAVIGLTGLLLGGFAIWRMLEGTPVAESARTDFVPVIATTPTAVELDPRAEFAPEAEIIPPGEDR